MRITADDVRLEMIGIVRMASEPRLPGDTIKTMTIRAGIRLGLHATRAKKLWYGEVSVVPAHEADQLRAAKRQIMRAQQERLRAQLKLLDVELSDENNAEIIYGSLDRKTVAPTVATRKDVG